MTQPRGQQVKSVNARYSVIRYGVTPGVAYSSLSASGFPYAVGGASEDVPGRVKGTAVSPIPVLGGDTISIRVDGAPAVPVVLSSTDTTVGRIVLKVNAALGAAIASNDAGYLVLSSTTVGDDSSIQIADGTAGMLSKLGMVAGIYSGKTAPADGLVTLSADGLGGIAPIATIDGKNLVTDGGKLIYFSAAGGGRSYLQTMAGGIPITGRVTYDGTDVRVSYFAKTMDRVRVKTLGSFFSLLDGTNTLTLGVNDQSFPVTFPSSPYTRDQVIDRINSAYASARGISDTWARADGTLSAPFSGLMGTGFNIEVDGTPQSVYFSTDPTTVAEVKAVIEGQVPGVTVAGTPNATTGPFIYIRSNNMNGRTSSLKIYAGESTDSSSRSLSLLGIRAGYYGGCYVADQYGPDEIEIFSSYRGPGAGSFPNVSVAGSGNTLTRMGLTSGTYFPADPSYVPVPPPHMVANEVIAQSYEVLLCYPSVLEFGDVPEAADVVVQQYLAKSAGTNVYPGNSVVRALGGGVIISSTTSRGFFDVGKPIVMSPEGILSSDAGGSQQSSSDIQFVEDIIRQITRLNSSEIVQAVCGTRFETPGDGSNTGTPSQYMDFVTDPTNVFSGSPRGFRYYVNPSVLGFSVEDFPGGTTAAHQVAAILRAGRSLFSSDSALRLADENTVTAEPVHGYVPLSSVNDKFLKVGGKTALSSLPNLSTYSLLQSTNARYEIYIGDGTESFGDFSGPTALSQAVAFLTSQGANRCKIIVKPGNYAESSTVNLNAFSDVSIDGLFPSGADGVTTKSTTFFFEHGGIGIQFDGALAGSFVFKNIKCVHSTASAFSIRAWASVVDIDACFFNSQIQFVDAYMFNMRRTQCLGLATRALYLDYTDAVSGTNTGYADVNISDCVMYSAADNSCVLVVDSTTFTQIRFRDFTIERCVCTPGCASTVGSAGTSLAFTSDEGVGVLGVRPSGNAYAITNGLVFEAINLKSLDIRAGLLGASGTTKAPTAIFLVPSGATGSADWEYGFDPAFRMDTVNVEDVNVEVVSGENFGVVGFRTPIVMVAGVGIPPYVTPFYGKYASGNLRVMGLFVNCNLGAHGSTVVSMIPFFQDPKSHSTLMSDAPCGLIGLAGQNVDINSIVVEDSIAGSLYETMMVCCYGSITFDGFTEEPRSTSQGDAAGPFSRLRFREAASNSLTGRITQISNIRMCGGFYVDSYVKNATGSAFIYFEAMENRSCKRSLSNFQIYGFGMPLGSVSGINVSAESYSYSYWLGFAGGIAIERGYIGNLGTGLQTMAYGIQASVGLFQELGNLKIRDVQVDGTSANGILILSGDQKRSITVQDCEIRQCGNLFGNTGLYAASSHTAGENQGAFYIRDNIVSNCNTASSGQYVLTQINVRDQGNGSSSQPTFAYITGNNCRSPNGQMGRLNVIWTPSLALPTSGSPSGINVQGAETGYTGKTGAYISYGEGLTWEPGLRCIHNSATFRSNVSDNS